jgi:hypothetical protein
LGTAGQQPAWPTLAALAAIIAAIVAGLFSLLGLLIAKENKISDFRQAWIDSLRNEIADFASAVTILCHAEPMNLSGAPALDYLETMLPTFDKAVNAQMRIRLRVNPKETSPEHKRCNDALLLKMQDIQDIVNEAAPATVSSKVKEELYTKAADFVRELDGVAAPVLKLEWERVKRGELLYVISRWITIGFIAIAILTGVYVFLKSVS